MHSLILAIRHVDVALLRIAREGDVPGRSGAEGVLRDEILLDELAFTREHLDAIVHAVTDVHEVVL